MIDVFIGLFQEQKGESDSEEEEAVAFLDRSDDEEEFDPSSLPDPDKHVDSESEDQNRWVQHSFQSVTFIKYSVDFSTSTYVHRSQSKI